MKTALLFLTVLAFVACVADGAHVAARPQIAPLQQQITALERQELETLKSGDWDAFSNLFADDATFLDAHGFAGKKEVLQHVSDVRIVDYSMEEIRVRPLTPDTALIAYKLKQKRTSHGKEFASQAYASAVWAGRGGKWLCIFTQETPAR